MKKKWIYELRAFAIIAVVVCHSQYLLHESEYIQLMTLYSVTTLIFLMGVTKYYSINNNFANNSELTFMKYNVKSLKAILLPYTLASFLGMSILQGTAVDLPTVWNTLLSFNAFGPYYFIKYVVIFTIWAPVIYFIVEKCCKPDLMHVFLSIIFILLLWMLGYITADNLNIFGSSYLVVYAAGVFVGKISYTGVGIHKKSDGILLAVLTAIILISGFVSAKRFYMSRVEGNYQYAEGIDALCPKLQLNPPNLSIIWYSAGVVLAGYLFWYFLNKREEKVVRLIINFAILIGKHSMDIFLWHMLIQQELSLHGGTLIKNIVVRNIVYYMGMIGLPILARELYEMAKKKMYQHIRLQCME